MATPQAEPPIEPLIEPKPLDQVQLVQRYFAPDLDDGADIKVPNHPCLPALLLCGAFAGEVSAARICSIYARNGWSGSWAWQVFSYHHFHPDAHEALTCSRGWAELRLGGPNGEDFMIEAGDALVLPAGVAHCLLAMSRGFEVCGSYPPGQENRLTWRVGPELKAGTRRMIAKVALPATDPLYGAEGPLVQSWRQARAGAAERA